MTEVVSTRLDETLPLFESSEKSNIGVIVSLFFLFLQYA